MSGLHLVTCEHCHLQAFRLVRGGLSDAGRFCSRGCSYARKTLVYQEKLSLRRIGVKARRAHRPLPLIRATCVQCQTVFAAKRNGRPRKWCHACKVAKAKAAKYIYKRKRIAIQRGASSSESIKPSRVFDRDGWRCYLCSVPTPSELRGTHHPHAPELDHVTPLSRGGSHTYTNIRGACRACNIGKSDLDVYQYLASIGMSRLHSAA